MQTLYKFLRTGLKSDQGTHAWKVGEWCKIDGALEMCANGFHASVRPIDALGHVSGEIIAEVEVQGEHEEQTDKQVWSEMRIKRAWLWKKEDSVSLAIFAAELVIGVYEEKHPNDDRPRKAIEAAKAWLADPSEKPVFADAIYAAAAAADAARAARASSDKCNQFMLDRLPALEEIS